MMRDRHEQDRHDMVTISLLNETTASEFLYEVSREIFVVLSRLTEEELSRAMPRQVPGGLGYESVSYGNALVELAKAHGVAERDIEVRMVSIPSFVFDTGWDCRMERANRSDSEYPSSDPLVPMSQGEIERLRQESEYIDGQMESSDGRSRFVSIVKHEGRVLAIAPTFETSSMPVEERIWDQPYEVRKTKKVLRVNTTRWEPVDMSTGEASS